MPDTTWLPGAPDDGVQPYETTHAALSRRAAAESIVLLKNDGLLPLAPGAQIALYGVGAVRAVQGGTGSGEVNNRASLSIRDGLRAAGFVIANEAHLDETERRYDAAFAAWQRDLLEKKAACTDGMEFFERVYTQNPFLRPEEPESEPCTADAAIYVISRVSGEGYDRRDEPGDYRLSETETAALAALTAHYPRVAVILNTGAPLDLSPLDALPVSAIVLLGQAGQEGGGALADVLSGAASPCGRLTDTWANRYADYPCARFGAAEGLRREYREGIYIGYRWFDTAGERVRYCFGFGLSYTRFALELLGAEQLGSSLRFAVRVTNAGERPGREVVQLYASCPQGALPKELRRLAAFGKTRVLAPGEQEVLRLEVPLEALASFDEAESRFVLEAGEYRFWLGESLDDARAVCLALLEDTAAVRKTQRLLAPAETIPLPAVTPRPLPPAAALPVLTLTVPALPEPERTTDAAAEEALRLAAGLGAEELLRLVVGDPTKGQGSPESSGVYPPGAAAVTTGAGSAPEMVLADGPAGLRLAQNLDILDGRIVPRDLGETLLRLKTPVPEGAARRWQFCTAFPVGTSLAQTFDRALIEEIGAAVGEEMRRFGVALWLAPGMNLHRDVLCGRNFEYYSEDPLLSGSIAAAMVRGVQSVPGCGATIKHFAANSWETQRMHTDSAVSERALRELYLRGFEIAVRESRPAAIMTSYNKLNGTHAANNRDLCTRLARGEWGFDGLIMTDWYTTVQSPDCSASGCIRAGNDLIMPGTPGDLEDLRAALADGSVSLEDLRQCAARILRAALRSRG